VTDDDESCMHPYAIATKKDDRFPPISPATSTLSPQNVPKNVPQKVH
jgi:hypothetical protein